MGGTVLYELRLHFNPIPALAALCLFAVFVWVECIRVRAHIIAGRKAKGRENKSSPSFAVAVLLILLFLAAAVITFGLIVRPMTDYRAVRDAYENGEALTAEGTVEELSLRQDFWNYYEEFTVDGVDFSGWVKVYGQGLPGYPMKFNVFDRDQRGGGLIRDGQRLRIQYVTLPGRGSEGEDYHAIVLIEELSREMGV